MQKSLILSALVIILVAYGVSCFHIHREVFPDFPEVTQKVGRYVIPTLDRWNAFGETLGKSDRPASVVLGGMLIITMRMIGVPIVIIATTLGIMLVDLPVVLVRSIALQWNLN